MSTNGSPGVYSPLPSRSVNPSSPGAITTTVTRPERGKCSDVPHLSVYVTAVSPGNGTTSAVFGSTPPPTPIAPVATPALVSDGALALPASLTNVVSVGTPS